MKSAQFDADDLDIDSWSNATIDGEHEEITDELETADDEQDDSTSDEKTEEFANSSDEKSEEEKSQEESSDNLDETDDKSTESDADDAEEDKEKDDVTDKDVGDKDDEESDILADIIENGEDAINKLVEKKLAERDAEAKAMQDEEIASNKQIKDSQDRFIKGTEEAQKLVNDFSDVVTDDLFEEIMKDGEVAMTLFDSKENAKATYVYAKTGLVFKNEETMLKQFNALSKLSPAEQQKEDSKVPPKMTGGQIGVTTQAYTDPDMVGWDD